MPPEIPNSTLRIAELMSDLDAAAEGDPTLCPPIRLWWMWMDPSRQPAEYGSRRCR